jgi:hypothetical protein
VIVLKQRTSSADRLIHDALHELFHASLMPKTTSRVPTTKRRPRRSSQAMFSSTVARTSLQ